jgi:3-dehydroquinate synthase
MIALGGGVVGDVAGYVASTYRRGIAFIQVPTTLLSQVDSSIGGKNGVNFPQGKNSVGTFHQPQFVLSDVALLTTLPRREVIAGLGEILKYPLVADPSMLTFIEHHLDDLLSVQSETVLEVASRCLRIKAGLVSEDERELFSDRGRVFLNIGHAVGHALETLSEYRLRHGEAVLLGILAEGHIAVRKTGFPERELQRFVAIYGRLKRRYDIRSISTSSIQRFALGKGGARFVLPRASGDPVVLHDVTADELAASVRFLRTL